eukprot:TRINITY_DN1034_c0_g1_i1.p3 TRINITY_DN1034_c0_g1~~TRINITY_DN1034_c0_g1_i1.p3  ORF type:complete len:110 (-),score=30.81 TRINITY_DN1034_c0_g1_i1:671-1000(-)
MNGSGLCATVVTDLTMVKQWTGVIQVEYDSWGVVLGTSPNHGKCVVFVQSARNDTVHFDDFEFQQGDDVQQHILALVDEDSTVSYFRVYDGLNTEVYPPSSKVATKIKS